MFTVKLYGSFDFGNLGKKLQSVTLYIYRIKLTKQTKMVKTVYYLLGY